MARRILWIMLAACALAASADKGAAVRELEWDDLLPEDEEPRPLSFDHSVLPPFDNFHIPAGIVPELNARR